MIKQPFTQTGVDNAQANFLTLTALEQSAVISLIRTDFDAWMNQWFALTTRQLQQIQTMDPDFKQKIAIAIANTYQAGYIVNFTKEDPGEDIPDRKETQVFGLEDWQDPNNDANLKILPIPLMIRISYGYIVTGISRYGAVPIALLLSLPSKIANITLITFL